MITIYHHPRCPFSREALHLIEEISARENLILEIIDYQQLPLSIPQLINLQKKLGLPISAMLRNQDPKYTKLKLSKADDSQLLQALVDYPKLLQRPIVEYQNRAVIAQPSAVVETLFETSGKAKPRSKSAAAAAVTVADVVPAPPSAE
ncbi:ArsC/Spx/MgsR family protein [Glaciimonas sp. CA11.2]|uniref:ArsC/Spx/MgsR family protein n=1 Tax=Glaciimonas sp. CA11.2 TaxID=3048601 RepID=UPI002AB33F37|nr:ArsC/Spx/MgsR family protein [Glaciimonas sp. CA11.2]MDY7545817.1 ArsC/Spx/MgsR family protein [Glaciimonas sp. CA11.2]MEB0163681.1 ArsC/Spx/MgsR family protein [Glaciimonas sp. CA11.2]